MVEEFWGICGEGSWREVSETSNDAKRGIT
jgi:hypothetical protein